jgi:hypothetical protein
MNKPLDKNTIIMYITDTISELKLTHRIEILQMIIYSNIDSSKIVEKGGGTQIKFSDLSDTILENIYNYIYNKYEGNRVI